MEEHKIIAFINKELSKSETADFEGWLQASEENQQLFNKYKQLWEASANKEELLEVDSKKMWAVIDPENKSSKKISVYTKFSRFSRIAAAILIMALAGFAIYFFSPGIHSNALADIIEVKAYNKEIILPDGTRVWLNKNSSIRYPEKFSKDERYIELTGEAYFEVQRNKQKAFRIKSGPCLTEVLGTKFNLNAMAAGQVVRVSVAEGLVSFAESDNLNNKILIAKGEEGQYDKESKAITKESIKDLNYASWKTGSLLFNNTSLKEVCKSLNRHYNSHIIIADKGLESLNLTARYEQKTLTEVLQILELTLDIHVSQTEEGIVLSK